MGISGGTIFRHFGSMDEILDAIVDRIEAEIFADFPPEADDPLESLRLFFEHRVLVMSSRPAISKLMQTNALVPSAHAEYRQERLGEFKQRSRRFVVDCLNDAGKRKLLSKDVNPEEAVIFVLGCLYAIGHMGIGTGTAKSAAELAQRTWRLLEKTLRA